MNGGVSLEGARKSGMDAEWAEHTLKKEKKQQSIATCVVSADAFFFLPAFLFSRCFIDSYELNARTSTLDICFIYDGLFFPSSLNVPMSFSIRSCIKRLSFAQHILYRPQPLVYHNSRTLWVSSLAVSHHMRKSPSKE